MTLVVAVTGPESIWLLADRRLSYLGGLPRDDGRKIMTLEATDGIALLGYAGLGATARRTEPADWMSAVLRGRKLPLEQCLGVLTDAIRTQFPAHMARMPGPGVPAHAVLIPAFVSNEPRLYEIDLLFSSNRRECYYRYTRHIFNPTPSVVQTTRIAIGGSGASYLMRDEAAKRTFARGLLRLMRAHDRGAVSEYAVADYLAKVNYEVHRSVNSVGPRCIVVWRLRKGGAHKQGGAVQYYTRERRDSSSLGVPAIANGMDITAVLNAIMTSMGVELFGNLRSPQPPNIDAVNAALARLPDKPDEELR